MDVEDARTIGARLRRIRNARKKSLRVIAGLAGMSKSRLSQIERGEVALDSISEIVALANALQIAPSELMRLPVPAPANGETDSAVEAVRSAMTAASRDRPGGLVLPVTVLRDRVDAALNAHYGCDPEGKVGAALPALIRDLHTSIAAGRDVAELLDLAVLLHAEVTVGWLRVAGAELDLRSEASRLALRAAQDRDTPTALGLATEGGMYVLVTGGEFDLAQAELDAVTVPTNTPEAMQLAGTLALCRSYVAAADSRPGDMDAPLELAAELADRIGEGANAYWLGFGPTNVGMWRMFAARAASDHDGSCASLRPCDQTGMPTGIVRPTTGSPTAARCRSCGGAAMTRCGRFAAPRRSRRITCTGTRSCARRSPRCSPAHGGTPRPSGSCGGWRTGRVCRYSPSAGRPGGYLRGAGARVALMLPAGLRLCPVLPGVRPRDRLLARRGRAGRPRI